MIHAVLTCLLLATGPAPGGGGGDEKTVVVHCKADAQVRGTEVLLADLAEVRTHDPELTERLLRTSFGQRPAFGFSRVLSRQDITLRLLREGLRAEVLQVAGARDVVLHPAVVRVLGKDVVDAAGGVLAAALELEPEQDVEFEPTASPESLLVPPGRTSMELRARLRDGRLERGSAVVEVEVLVDAEPFKVVRVSYRLRRYQRVLVAAKAIDKGAPLGEENLELRRVEAPFESSPYLVSFDGVRGKVAARELRAGAMLTLRSVSDPAVVYTGDPINLVAVNGRVQVAARALALQDGAVGDRIAVRNLTSNKIVQAAVHGPGLVVIELQPLPRQGRQR